MPGFLKRFPLEFTVFSCGAVVMVYEIIGSRIVSPFIGTSTYVWTSLIGVILASLSAGYWIGGRIADKYPDAKILASTVFAAGGAVSLTILIKDVVLATIGASAMGLGLKAVTAALLLFAPASVLLGIVTPFAVKLRMSALDDSGKTVGRLYALSTIGSIAGTFAAGFFLIPFVGSTRTLYLIGASLFGISLLLAPFVFTRVSFMILTLFVLAIGGSEFTSYALFRTSSLHDIDTEYSRVQVFQTTDPKNGRKFQAMAIDPYFVQSAMYLDGDDPVFEYSRFYHLVSYFKPDHKRTLMIGGAGYTFPREYLRTYPQARMDVVEIDPQMTEIARKYFRLTDDPRLSIIHQDGRTFLNSAETGKYDAVMMDAFSSLFNVPYQLTTVEAVRQINRVLTDDGVVIFNLGSAIKGPASNFLQAEFATYKQVFPHVYLFKVNSDRTDEQLQNLIIVASKGTAPYERGVAGLNSPPGLRRGGSVSLTGWSPDGVAGLNSPPGLRMGGGVSLTGWSPDGVAGLNSPPDLRRGGSVSLTGWSPDGVAGLNSPPDLRRGGSVSLTGWSPGGVMGENLNSSRTDSSEKIENLLANIYSKDFPLERPILTDDLAPVEYYNSEALKLYQKK